MDKNLIDAIEKIKKLSTKDAEFDAAMRKLFGETDSASGLSNVYSSNRIDEIYEYCIEKVVKEQSEQFYKHFPIIEIVPSLVNDFCRMERYKREDNFEDFCLAVFQQVECITNWFCQRPKFIELFDEHKTDESLIKDKGVAISVWKLIIQSDFDTRKDKPLIKLFFNERVRAVLYWVYFDGQPYKYAFDSIYNELNELYQCRNLNHRGGESTPYQESIISNILPHRYLYYLKFTGLLVNFVEHISAYMSKREETGVIINVLPSAVYIKPENGDVITIDKGKLWYKVKALKKDDVVIIERNTMTKEVLNIKLQ